MKRTTVDSYSLIVALALGFFVIHSLIVLYTLLRPEPKPETATSRLEKILNPPEGKCKIYSVDLLGKSYTIPGSSRITIDRTAGRIQFWDGAGLNSVPSRSYSFKGACRVVDYR